MASGVSQSYAESTLPVPPEPTFKQQYNSNRELPIGIVIGVLVYAVVALLIVMTLRYWMVGPDKKPVAIKPVLYIEGDANEDGDTGKAGEEG